MKKSISDSSCSNTEWVKLGTHEKHKSVSKYKAEKLREEIEAADKLLDMKKSELSSVEDQVRAAESTLEDKKQELSKSEEKLSSVTAETEKADADLSKKVEQINRTLKYLPDLKKHEDAEHEYLVAVSELHDMLKSGMSILRNKDSIISRIDTLKSLTQKAMDKRDKAELSIYDLRQRGEEVVTERDNALEKLNAVRAEKSALYSELKTVHGVQRATCYARKDCTYYSQAGERDAQRATAERTGTAIRIPTHQKEKIVGLGITGGIIMIIRSKDKVQMGGKNKPVWMLDTDALTVTHTITDAESSVTKFSSDHIKYHLHYSAEYRPARLKKLVNDGTILSYLIDLDRSIAEAIERQVGMMLENDTEYLRAVAVGDLAKARGLENMDRLIARDPVYAAMVYV